MSNDEPSASARRAEAPQERPKGDADDPWERFITSMEAASQQGGPQAASGQLAPTVRPGSPNTASSVWEVLGGLILLAIAGAVLYGLFWTVSWLLSADDSGPKTEQEACYALMKQMHEEGHSRDKQWLNDALDSCDRQYP